MHRILATLAITMVLASGATNSAATTSRAAADAGDWIWPVDPPRVVERPFIAPATRYSAGHRGVDLLAGAIVYAPADGTVRFAGVVVDRPVLSIDHGGGVVSSYEPVVASVAKGDTVTAGQAIGTVLEGHCRSPCVHVGVRVDGEYVSPLSFFGEIPRAVLLPTRG